MEKFLEEAERIQEQQFTNPFEEVMSSLMNDVENIAKSTRLLFRMLSKEFLRGINESINKYKFIRIVLLSITLTLLFLVFFLLSIPAEEQAASTFNNYGRVIQLVPIQVAYSNKFIRTYLLHRHQKATAH